MSAFDLDPWKVAERHYEREMHLFMCRLMRHLGVTQIEVPNYPVSAKDELVMTENFAKNSRFYRIKGEFQITTPDEVSREEAK